MRPTRLVVLALASAAAISIACGDDNGNNPSVTTDLTGLWDYSVKVTAATGVCAGEVGDSGMDVVDVTVIDANGDGTYDVTMSGFLGDPTATITGTVTGVTQVGDKLTVSGSYPEDGGITTTTHHLTIQSETRLTGTEDWSWVGGGNSCPNGHAKVVVIKH